MCVGPTEPVAVHPRVRGEHRGTEFHISAPSGSSPRARGTLHLVLPKFEFHRFIPACAGNTPSQVPGPPLQPVHPRVRGEHCSSSARPSGEFGSSPRARGTLFLTIFAVIGSWFIPACAGNTDVLGSTPRWASVHPRVRGEHIGASLGRRIRSGSSPRARGTRILASESYHLVTVHPRVRGEHPTGTVMRCSIPGSSPRARGTRYLQPCYGHAIRFIPACAGNT